MLFFNNIYIIRLKQAEVETEVTKTQYGFRPAKSTAHAICVTRRMQDFAEKSNQPLYMTLLDWEKSFDEIDNKCLAAALERLGIDNAVIETLSDGYKKATFFVEDDFRKSGTKTQSSGIRQGCPLSPYLCVLVMTCIEKPASKKTSQEKHQKKSRET